MSSGIQGINESFIGEMIGKCRGKGESSNKRSEKWNNSRGVKHLGRQRLGNLKVGQKVKQFRVSVWKLVNTKQGSGRIFQQECHQLTTVLNWRNFLWLSRGRKISCWRGILQEGKQALIRINASCQESAWRTETYFSSLTSGVRLENRDVFFKFDVRSPPEERRHTF